MEIKQSKGVAFGCSFRPRMHMGHITLINSEFVSLISESAGFKTGLALDKAELYELLPDDSRHKEIFSFDDDVYIRLHSSELDQVFAAVLYQLGSVDSPVPIPHTIRLFHKYKDDKVLRNVYEKVQEMYVDFLGRKVADCVAGGSKIIDPTDFMVEATKSYGRDGLTMSYELIVGNSEDMQYRLSSFRRVEWKNTIDLKDLFISESIDTMYGKFIDQRYVDYLERNGYKIKKMNWRKFEALTAEYFDRQGYQVELGRGRNDGGIDIRVWKENKAEDDPPLILIQCKRHKEKIDKTVVKALWADVSWEKASSGLIVTTSEISHGAKNDCVARGYNIQQANGETIQGWLKTMRTPGAGVFLGK